MEYISIIYHDHTPPPTCRKFFTFMSITYYTKSCRVYNINLTLLNNDFKVAKTWLNISELQVLISRSISWIHQQWRSKLFVWRLPRNPWICSNNKRDLRAMLHDLIVQLCGNDQFITIFWHPTKISSVYPAKTTELILLKNSCSTRTTTDRMTERERDSKTFNTC